MTKKKISKWERLKYYVYLKLDITPMSDFLDTWEKVNIMYKVLCDMETLMKKQQVFNRQFANILKLNVDDVMKGYQ